MAFPARALLDPAAEHRHLSRGKGLPRLCRGHPLGLVFGFDPAEQLAVVGPTRDHRAVSAEVHRHPLRGVEPQVGLPTFRVRTVAAEARVGEDRPDVAVEPHGLRDRLPGRGRRAHGAEQTDRDERANDTAQTPASCDVIPHSWALGLDEARERAVGRPTRHALTLPPCRTPGKRRPFGSSPP